MSIAHRFPNSAEHFDNIYERVQNVKQFMKFYLSKAPKSESHKKVLVISHQAYLKFWTANWDGFSRPITSLPKTFASIKNWEFYPDKMTYL